MSDKNLFSGKISIKKINCCLILASVRQTIDLPAISNICFALHVIM